MCLRGMFWFCLEEMVGVCKLAGFVRVLRYGTTVFLRGYVCEMRWIVAFLRVWWVTRGVACQIFHYYWFEARLGVGL